MPGTMEGKNLSRHRSDVRHRPGDGAGPREVGRPRRDRRPRRGPHPGPRGTRSKRRRETRRSNRCWADFSSLAEVRRLAAEFRARHRHLDVLVNNAAPTSRNAGSPWTGFERTWAVNHLASFLLTLELLDVLKASAPARIVNVSSALHFGKTLALDKIEEEKTFGIQGYGQSKLANVPVHLRAGPPPLRNGRSPPTACIPEWCRPS